MEMTTTEIAQFNSADGISDEEFIAIVDRLEADFHMKQNGYLDTELLKGRERNQWIMVQHWRSDEDAKNSSRNMMSSSETEEFRRSIDPKTVKLSYNRRIRSWVI